MRPGGDVCGRKDYIRWSPKVYTDGIGGRSRHWSHAARDNMRRQMVKRSILIVLALTLLVSGCGMCCVGARPLAMGGAFVGLADDANATYWNPAGLAGLPKSMATGMYTANNRDRINYLEYGAYTGKLPQSNAGFGVSFAAYRLGLGKYGLDEQTWLWVSGAYQAAKDTAIGLNVRFISDSISGVSSETALDLSFLKVVNEKWSFGLLIQDINESGIKDGSDLIAKHGRNVRPGIAYRYDESTVFTADIYDALNHSDAMALRFGAEKKLPNGLAVRGGFYGTGDCAAFTAGLGGRIGGVLVDGAVMTGDLENTILLSASTAY